MSLPIRAIDRLFERLAATYGSAWVSQWDRVPLADVKTAWAHELSGFTNRLQDVAWALEHLPERVPNAIEFKNLVKKSPLQDSAAIKDSRRDVKPDMERVRAEIGKMSSVLTSHGAESSDRKGWAKRFIERAENGQKISPLYLRWARDALASNER